MRTKANQNLWEMGAKHSSHIKTHTHTLALLWASSKMVQTVILPLGWIHSEDNPNMYNMRWNTEKD